jgi:hypothetical protein
MPNNIQLVITDLTQMPSGDRVCVAGIDQNNKCYRLCWEDGEGIPKDNLIDKNGNLIIRPRAKISVKLWPIDCKPPHIEDHGFDPFSIKYQGLCNDIEWIKVLKRSAFNSLHEMFSGFLRGTGSVLPGSQTRSLGTVIPINITDSHFNGLRPPKPRLTFIDNTRNSYDRPIADIAVREYCFKTIIKDKNPALKIVSELFDAFTQNRIFLRIGLARPWGTPPLCWTQVTGIYTLPDYLKGKSFVDFE